MKKVTIEIDEQAGNTLLQGLDTLNAKGVTLQESMYLIGLTNMIQTAFKEESEDGE